MKISIELLDGHELELTDVGIETHNESNTIALSVDALIKGLDDDTLAAFEDWKLHPLSLVFVSEDELPIDDDDRPSRK
ncbi:hypothetical protein [Haladaptatus salinisoli]|uniref:hypothetical protein n=1 Tax=Haladaptatus salinisoli TaxID=2884876 RepID=UPI001D0BCA45|nr:hypothetical protein [Haladaptatus salinisoli]